MNDEYVYVIGTRLVNPVKIGWSKDPNKRLTQLQPASSLPLKILATYPGGRSLEAWLHREFRKFRKHGEWFNLGYKLDEIEAAVRRYRNFETWRAKQ